tara:strand:- start:412 stop:552 length:141 start_codon:yes stop_codon:yes gene_type:complete
MKKYLILLSALLACLVLLSGCSKEEPESSPLDGEPVPSPDKPDIPE